MIQDFYRSPPDYQALGSQLQELKNRFPFLKLFHIGKSVLGRKIYAVGLGNIKHSILFAAAFHAQEWLTCSLMIRYLEDICTAIRRNERPNGMPVKESLLYKGLLIVPMVNPDGVEIALHGSSSAKHLRRHVRQIMESSERSWQANARGVDLNHNYDAGFRLTRIAEINSGITGPSPRQFGGLCAHSEPETKAMVNLCTGFDIRTAFAFHSQGEEIYYAYGKHTPEVSPHMAALFASYCGYTVAEPTGLASHGGFKDWFINTLHRPGFTFEIGKGENPLPITDLEPVYEKLKSTLIIASTI